MNWALVLPLAALGAVMGMASVFGLTAGIEGALWAALATLVAWRLGMQERNRPFRHGFFTGLLGGAASPLVQALWITPYLANDPARASEFARLPGPLGPRAFLLALSPVVGLVSGLTLGVLTLVMSRLASSWAAWRSARRGLDRVS